MRATHANASFEGGIISFIFIALGDNVALDAVSTSISVVAKVALAGDSVEGFVDSASSAGVEDPEVSIIAVALTVLEVAIDSTVLVAAAFSVDDSVASIADTALSSLVPMGIEGTFLGVDTFALINGHAVGAHAFSVDVGSSNRADGLAVAVVLPVSGLAETSIGVGVVVLTGVAVGADSSDSDVPGLTDAGLGGF